MAAIDPVITDQYALYNSDCVETVGRMKDKSIHMSLYSPPFCGLFQYSSSNRDMSNCRSYEEFFENYSFIVRELLRVTIPGRISAVHVMDVPGDGANAGGDTIDFPGDVIRLHKQLGWKWACRYMIWKEPFAVRLRTMAKGLAHCQIVEDSSLCDNAAADQLLIFRKPGKNPIPIAHPTGLSEYIGERQVPAELLKYRNWQGDQTKNKYSQWVWRQYASSYWSDIRLGRVLPYKAARDKEDQRHIHPLQLDVIERAVTMWSNPGETILSPFAGIGSEIAGSVMKGRKGVGCELKETYFNQMVRNVAWALENAGNATKDQFLFDAEDEEAVSEVAGLS